MCSVHRQCILFLPICKTKVVYRLSHHYQYLSFFEVSFDRWSCHPEPRVRRHQHILGLFFRVTLTSSSEHASLSWKTSMASRHCLSPFFKKRIFVTRHCSGSEAAVRSFSKRVRSIADSVTSSSKFVRSRAESVASCLRDAIMFPQRRMSTLWVLAYPAVYVYVIG